MRLFFAEDARQGLGHFGHAVEQGDWSLLDPVRKRPPLYRVVE
jgi:hypothetical protein